MKIPRHTSRGIVVRDGKLLLIERWRDNLHYYSIPGGGIEPGETLETAAIREIKEETSCEVKLEQLLYVMKSGDRDHHIYLCEYISGEAHLPADSPEALENDPNNRFEPCWRAIESIKLEQFNIWHPVIKQLLNDLKNGFQNHPIEIVVDDKP